MLPIVTPEAMAAIDLAHADQFDELIARAGAAVARAAVGQLGGTYGRRVVVIAGKGNNGNDGRIAAAWLRRRGVRVQEVAPDHGEPISADLVIDAAYGNGLRREYQAPVVVGSPVLAVDMPSGINGLTGEAMGSPLHADTTVTFVAHKPGLLMGEGRAHAGPVMVIDLGLPVAVPGHEVSCWMVTDDDVTQSWPRRHTDAHKWKSAVWVVGGSSGMTGAPELAAAAAFRGGAGYVRLSVPGVAADNVGGPTETVRTPIDDLTDLATADGRFGALVVGPGLGRADTTAAQLQDFLAQRPETSPPVVLDGDALHLLEGRRLDPSVVITPHDGEYRALMGRSPGADRIAEARALAERTGATTLLKGPTTVVADPSGDAHVVTSGDARLATAGSGDVLAGLIGAALAQGLPPMSAASLGAHVHGRASQLGARVGMVAGDLPMLVADVLSRLARPA